MDNALQLIYYAWQKAMRFLLSCYIDNNSTVSIMHLIFGITILGILLAYVLPIPRRNK